MRSRTLALLAVFALGCTSSKDPNQANKPADPAGDTDPAEPEPPTTAIAEPDTTAEPVQPEPLPSIRAKVEIDDEPGGKRFQGVWLVPEDGSERMVIAYRPDPWWQTVDGRTVDVDGETYQPEGQAIGAIHFRVRELRVVDPTPEDQLIIIRGKREFSGQFTTHTWPAGTKLEGEKSTVFVSDAGTQYWMETYLDPAPPMDERVTIEALEVEPSNFVARPGGPYLWVVDID